MPKETTWAVGLVLGLLGSIGSAHANQSSATSGTTATAETITLKIEGWTCPSCERDIRDALQAVPGVRRVDVSYARGGAVVEVEPDRVTSDRLVRAVEGASTLFSSYHATVVPHGSRRRASGHGEGWMAWLRGLFQ